jgi:hypothetical protein
MMDLQAAMDRILLTPHNSIPIATSAFADGQPIAAFTNLHLPGQTIVATYPGYAGGADVPDVLEINLRATWNDFQGRQRALTLSTSKSE